MGNLWQKFKLMPTWVFGLLFIISGIVSVVALRANNEHMVHLRDAVYTADKNNGDVNAALNNLRDYVYAHMNTNLSSGTNGIKPPIQLKYTYQRLQDAAQAASDSANSKLYTDAENYCQAQIPANLSISGRARVPCVQDYVLGHGGTQPATIPASLYQFDFVSPTWSPDLAGWSLVISLALALAAVAGFLAKRI